MMLYLRQQDSLRKRDFTADGALPENVVWFDMLNLTAQEAACIENALGINIPSREEMHEIELSSRLYHENGAVYMTATLVTNADTPQPESLAFTFILAGGHLITIRYTDPIPFRQLADKAEKLPPAEQAAHPLFAHLMENIVERVADILERIGKDVDAMTRSVFRAEKDRQGKKPDYREVLEQIGREGDLVAKTRESLVTINRMVGYALQSQTAQIKGDARVRLDTLLKDIHALSDHANFLSNTVGFLLDATLGMINIEQNAIIKIFSVAAVAFLPPTLIASVYGMNFDFMPELGWRWGYPLAIGLMVISAVVPFLYFKRRKWL